MIGYYAGLNENGEPELIKFEYDKVTAKQAHTTDTFGEALIGTRAYVGRRVPLDKFFTTEINGIQYLRRCLRWQAVELRERLAVTDGHDRRLKDLYEGRIARGETNHDQA